MLVKGDTGINFPRTYHTRWIDNKKGCLYFANAISNSWLLPNQRLIHWGRVKHMCVSKLCHQRFRKWRVTWSAPSHYLNQWLLILNRVVGNILQSVKYWSKYKFYKQLENVVRKMAIILSPRPCVLIKSCLSGALNTSLTGGRGQAYLPVIYRLYIRHRCG